MTWASPVPSGEICQEHYEVTSDLGLRGCLDDLEAHLGLRTCAKSRHWVREARALIGRPGFVPAGGTNGPTCSQPPS